MSQSSTFRELEGFELLEWLMARDLVRDTGTELWLTTRGLDVLAGLAAVIHYPDGTARTPGLAP